MNQQQRLERAARVREAMEGGVVAEAFQEAEADYTRALVDCHDRDERDRLWLAVQVVRKVRSHLAEWEGAALIGERQAQEIKRLARAR